MEAIIRRSYANSWSVSVLGKECVVCHSLEGVQAHHVRKLRELRNRPHLDSFTMQMAAVNRKQVPLCHEHHVKLHKGTMNDSERKSFAAGIRNSSVEKNAEKEGRR